MYDGRDNELDLDSDRPFKSLPLFNGDLKRGDYVWFGFHATGYASKLPNQSTANYAGLNIAWLVLLNRGGEHAWDMIQEPK